ncbi:hypothetical protein GCM10022419_082770 [Nonomuraea rosea]|uniref:Thioredoxin domain-containing protein n=1 Tax=Nonomuraea rosea TaxID=638574 RepID=A0ABP6YPG5_9ACTN
MIEPASAVSGSAYLALIAVLLYAVVGKARDVRAFAAAIGGYRLLPGRLTVPAAYLVIAAEVAAAGLLAAPPARRWGAVLAGLLFAAFLTGMASVLSRGLRVACGCFGGDADAVSPRTLLRTGLLLVLAVLAAVAGGTGFSPAHLLFAPLLLAAALLPPALIRSSAPPAPGPRPGDRFVLSAPPAGHPVLYALISPSCGLCSAMLPAFAAAASRMDVVLVGAASEEEVRAYLDGHGVDLPLVIDPGVFEANDIPWPPYAVLTGRDGVVLAAGGAADPVRLTELIDLATDRITG